MTDWLRQGDERPVGEAASWLYSEIEGGVRRASGMQPAMGSGVLSSRTPRPVLNCLKSLCNHAVFGGCLYLAAQLVARHS